MKGIFYFVLLGGILLISSSCIKQLEQYDAINLSDMDVENAMNEVVDFVALGSKEAGTKGAENAAAYLNERLKNYGVESHIDTFSDKTPSGEFVFRNVLGRIPGNGKKIIMLGSHYDTKGGLGENFLGANDSGSSTGLLLELARLLQQKWNGSPDIQIVFFDGEECKIRYSLNDGLHGSRHLAKQVNPGSYIAVIILDMIGDKNLSVTIPRNCSEQLIKKVFNVAKSLGHREKFGLYPHGIGDDHVPFLRRGIPVLNLIDFQYGSEPGLNDFWHTKQDTMEKISQDSLKIVGEVVLELLNRLAIEK